MVGLLLLLTVIEWARLLLRTRSPNLSETEPVWLSPEDVEYPGRSSPAHVMGAVALGLTMLKELSGEAAVERERSLAIAQCTCTPEQAQTKATRQNVYLSSTERRFNGVRRCC
jgi:carbon starvation protein